MATAANPFDIQTGNTTGAALTGPATPPAPGTTVPGTMSTAAQFGAQEREVKPETETTAGQLQSILSKDSPLMQLARTQATQGMAQRGLINSSMSQGAGVAAMLEKATPIAAADATIYSNRATANQAAFNTGGQFNVGEQNKFGLEMSGQKFTAEQNQLTQNFQAAQAQLDRAQQTSLSDKSVEATANLQKAQQNFDAAQNALNRTQQTELQKSEQVFQTSTQLAQQEFTKAQSELDRATQIS